jgi:hypothetical protein
MEICGSWVRQQSVCQWLRLALSKGLTWLGTLYPMMETVPFWNICVWNKKKLMDTGQNSTQACPRGCLFNDFDALKRILFPFMCNTFLYPSFCNSNNFLQCSCFHITPNVLVVDFIISIEILFFQNCYLLFSVSIYVYVLLSSNGQVVFLCNIMFIKFPCSKIYC